MSAAPLGLLGKIEQTMGAIQKVFVVKIKLCVYASPADCYSVTHPLG